MGTHVSLSPDGSAAAITSRGPAESADSSSDAAHGCTSLLNVTPNSWSVALSIPHGGGAKATFTKTGVAHIAGLAPLARTSNAWTSALNPLPIATASDGSRVDFIQSSISEDGRLLVASFAQSPSSVSIKTFGLAACAPGASCKLDANPASSLTVGGFAVINGLSIDYSTVRPILSADGTTLLVVGANLPAGVYRQTLQGWTQEATLSPGDQGALSQDGSVALISNRTTGIAQVVVRGGAAASWSILQDFKIAPEDMNPTTSSRPIGVGLSADGSRALIGNPYAMGGVGMAALYERSD